MHLLFGFELPVLFIADLTSIAEKEHHFFLKSAVFFKQTVGHLLASFHRTRGYLFSALQGRHRPVGQSPFFKQNFS